jgi:hypothetical protein
MKTIGKLIAATAIVLGAMTGVTTSTAAGVMPQTPPWFASTTYYTGGVATGLTRYYCDGRIRDTGDVWTYDDSVHVVYYECP